MTSISTGQRLRPLKPWVPRAIVGNLEVAKTCEIEIVRTFEVDQLNEDFCPATMTICNIAKHKKSLILLSMIQYSFHQTNNLVEMH